MLREIAAIVDVEEELSPELRKRLVSVARMQEETRPRGIEWPAMLAVACLALIGISLIGGSFLSGSFLLAAVLCSGAYAAGTARLIAPPASG